MMFSLCAKLQGRLSYPKAVYLTGFRLDINIVLAHLTQSISGKKILLVYLSYVREIIRPRRLLEDIFG